MSEVLSELLI